MEIRFESRMISDEEAARHQDFDAILAQHQSMQTLNKYWHRGLGAGVLLLMLSAGWFWYSTNFSSTPAAVVPQQQTEAPVNSPSLTGPEAGELLITEPAAHGAEDNANNTPLPQEAENNSIQTAPVLPQESRKETEPKQTDNPAATSAPKPDKEEKAATPEHAPDNFTYADAQPKEGYPHLYTYFSEALQYPLAAMEAGEEGTVILSFTVDVNGRATDIAVEKGLSDALNSEAIRLVSNMPAWLPASINGKSVTSRKTLPISFKID